MFRSRIVRRGSIQSLIVAGILLGACASAGADEATIQFDYTARPFGLLPKTVHQITVKKPNYRYRATEDGIMHDNEQGWYQLFIRDLQDQFGASAQEVVIYDWEDQVSRDDEVRAAQLRGGDPDAGPANPPRASDATMIVRFRVKAEKSRLEHRESVPQQILGRIICRYTGASHGSRWTTRFKVNVRCDIHLTMVGSGRTLYVYSEDLERIEDSDEGFLDLGIGGRSVAELPSTDRLIQELVREHVDNFLSAFLPVQRTIHAVLQHVHRDDRPAIEALNVNNYQKARRIAWLRWGHKHSDHVACFVVGATYEAENNWEEAINWYRRAVRGEPENSYYYNAMKRATASQKRATAAQRNQRSARAKRSGKSA